MARKTNKTDHVLNLLSSGKKANAGTKEEKDTPPVDLRKKNTPPPEEPESEPAAAEAEEVVPEVSVVHTSGDDNPIADAVKESLEAEFGEYLKEKEQQEADAKKEEGLPDLPEEPEQQEDLPDLPDLPKTSPEPEHKPEPPKPAPESVPEPVPPNPTPAQPSVTEQQAPAPPEIQPVPVEEAPPIKQKPAGRRDLEINVSALLGAKDEPEDEPEPAPEPETPKPAPEPKPSKPVAPTLETPEPIVPKQEPVSVPPEPPVQPEASIPTPTQEPKEEPKVEAMPEQPKEKDYETVNVMEYLVRDQSPRFIRQFGHCDCDRCIEDTVALALTHLPAKYVVVNKAAVSPLLNFYEKRYAGQLIVEITKATMIVNENPNH